MPLEQNKLSQSVQTKHLLPKANIEIGVGSFNMKFLIILVLYISIKINKYKK